MGKRRVWKGRFSSLGVEGQNYGGGGEIKVENIRFVPQIFWGVILLSMSKITHPSGSCAQDAAGIGVAGQCRHWLSFAMFPRLAPAASFA